MTDLTCRGTEPLEAEGDEDERRLQTGRKFSWISPLLTGVVVSAVSIRCRDTWVLQPPKKCRDAWPGSLGGGDINKVMLVVLHWADVNEPEETGGEEGEQLKGEGEEEDDCKTEEEQNKPESPDKRPRTLSAGMFTFHWWQHGDKSENTWYWPFWNLIDLWPLLQNTQF